MFALAFEGALLPLRYSEPALSPLLALPNKYAPRRPELGDPPTVFSKLRCKGNHYFCFQQVKERFFLFFGPSLFMGRGGRFRASVLRFQR